MKRAIYTYCTTRFDEPGGGWGFFSYTKGLNTLFADKIQFEEQLGSRVYTNPDNNRIWLKVPFVDTAETYEYEQAAITKYHPELFSYRTIHGKDSEYSCLIYAKNLGREIKNANRPSNQVVYSLIGSGDEIKDYPCFYAGNHEFASYTRDYFKQTQERADSLEEMVPYIGETVTRESVHRFLQEDSDRVDDLVKLFYTLINERSGHHRPILICDKKDNIIYWIAAVTMLFPLEIAKKIEFTTYDYLDTGDQVVTMQLPLCGVYSPTVNDAPESRATNYDLDTLQNNGNVILFDFECVIKPEVSTDAFEDKIREFCNGNEEPLLNYHRYIIENTTYRDFGNEYTYFCSSEADQIKVFQYYSYEIQKEIFDHIYPSLYDSAESNENVIQAIKVTKLAIENGLISHQQIVDDLSAYTLDFIRSSSLHIDDYKRLDPVFEEAKLSSDDMIRHIILEDIAIVDQIYIQDSVCLQKVIYILHLMKLDQKNDFHVIKKMFEKLHDAPNHNAKGQELILEWFKKYFSNNGRLGSPELMLDLLSLSGNRPIEIIRQIEDQLIKWPQNYSKEIVINLGISKYSSIFFRTLENDSFYNHETVIHSCSILVLFSEVNAPFTARYCSNFFLRLSEQNIKIQKSALDYIMTKTTYPFDMSCYRIAEQVLKRYPFDDIDDLANFSFLLYAAIDEYSENNNPIVYIINALQKLEGTKKMWKKSVESITVSCRSIERQDQIKHKLIADVSNTMIEETQEKGNPLKKLIERFKKS